MIQKQFPVVTDTLTNEFLVLKKHTDKPFMMYVCGITPYDYAHLGHARCYVVFDVVYRLLKEFKYNVLYCRNITDIEDKLIRRAKETYGDPTKFKDVADNFYKHYQDDMQALNCLSPDKEPRVTDVIPEIISFIDGLIKKGHAYEVNGDVYFDVESYPLYGKLAHRDLSEQQVGARIAENEQKKNPLDFALWKSAVEKPCWESPWGNGRPGWHIECSVMSQLCCGENLDLHGGGMDLIFPHHENERAQSEALHGSTYARVWMHCAFIRLHKEKMSKSLGNFITIKDVFQKGYDSMALRYFIISHHYRSPLNFSWEGLDEAVQRYNKLSKMFEHVSDIVCDGLDQAASVVSECLDFLKRDFNVPGMLGVIFENAYLIKKDEYIAQNVKQLLEKVCGLKLATKKDNTSKEYAPEVHSLLDAREEARKNKNWKRADEIRDQLVSMGVNVQDKKL